MKVKKMLNLRERFFSPNIYSFWKFSLRLRKWLWKPLGGSSHSNILNCIFSSAFTFRWIGWFLAWKELVIHALHCSFPSPNFYSINLFFPWQGFQFFFFLLIPLSTHSFALAPLFLWFLFLLFISPKYRIFFSSGCYMGWNLSSKTLVVT